MSIEGSINVSALFHDRDGTTSVKVVSLRSSNEYTTGKVAIVTGTVGTAAATLFDTSAAVPYRDASGTLVQFGNVSQALFSWSGTSKRYCEFQAFEGQKVVLASESGSVSASRIDGSASNEMAITAGGGTGTYTIVLYGT